MALFLAQSVILVLASFAAAQRIVRPGIDRLLVAFLLAWSNIVATSLLLSILHRLGEPAWFFRTSLLLALVTWVGLRKFVSEPPPAEPASEDSNPWLLVLFFGTLAPLAYASIRIAATYEPNNYDSLAYHLPRAMYYLGQNSLSHFDTGNPRQIFFPFDYNLLQLFGLIYNAPLQCLTFFNLVSWAVSGLAIYRICRLCPFGFNASLVATWLALTATQVLSQATATTNDLPVASVLLCAVAFGLQWTQTRLARHALLAGCAAGLAAGSKLTLVYFGPAAVLLLLVIAHREWRRRALGGFFAGVRAWIFPALLAAIFAAPFALINLAEKKLWMTKSYDFILNKPFSFSGALQTAKAYLLQLFIEPLHRFTFDLDFTARLNEWGTRTFFPHWNPAHAISGLYLFPPDLNEDHVWFGLAGPLILLCAVFCLVRYRKLQVPSAWLALLGLGWLIAFFCLNKWSLYNQRYFVPVMLLMSPCVAATIEACLPHRRLWRTARYILITVAVSAFWLAGVYLFKNTSRPYAPLWAGTQPPPALPVLPSLMAQRLSTPSRINIDSDDGNERIFLLMTLGKHQRFTASEKVHPDAYNVFSRWGFPRGMAFTNIEQLASFVAVHVPTKRTAGVEFLGTLGTDVGAIDYYGLAANADQLEPTEDARNIFVTLNYGPKEPGRYAKTRIRVAGLNPDDQARVVVGLESEDHAAVPLAAFSTDGDTTVSINQPFRRFTVAVLDESSGQEIGFTEIPHLFRDKPAEPKMPLSSSASLFVAEVISANATIAVAAEGLASLEGPYPKWNLPLFRWAKSPVVRLKIPATEKLDRLQLSFGVRLHVRDSADLDVLLNGVLVQHYHIEGSTTWSNQTLQLNPQPGENIVEFRNVSVGTEPDWLGYLNQYRDVRDWLVAQNIPLEQGAQKHYELNGKAEGRVLNSKRTTVPVDSPDQLYFIFRNLRLEGFRSQ